MLNKEAMERVKKPGAEKIQSDINMNPSGEQQSKIRQKTIEMRVE